MRSVAALLFDTLHHVLSPLHVYSHQAWATLVDSVLDVVPSADDTNNCRCTIVSTTTSYPPSAPITFHHDAPRKCTTKDCLAGPFDLCHSSLISSTPPVLFSLHTLASHIPLLHHNSRQFHCFYEQTKLETSPTTPQG